MRLLTRRNFRIGAIALIPVVLIAGVLMLDRINEAHCLYYFQATGIVASFRPASGGGMSLNIKQERTCSNLSTCPAGSIGGYQGVISRAIALPPGVLHEGATFEKPYMSRYCRVDGKEYVFVRFFPWQ